MAEQTTPRTDGNKPYFYLYHHDPETELAIIVGKVFVDGAGDAWVTISKEDLAEAIGVEDIDGVALMTRGQFALDRE